ncbi:YciI family protein [Streptomyces sp. SID13031]|uniref:YciI family protein n=1 Tax=Streptomyces sp. SID13031 TaxID=2706046 RepID=UPI0013C5A986|nr:YciI family protein [Streptomyces sp. SID13031]NEA31574.1 YciI family protein [Streptomyces sp. SID13031]
MKYMLLIHSNPVTWGHPSFLHTEEGKKLSKSALEVLSTQLDKLLTELSERGELVVAEPLAAPRETKVVRVRDGVRATTDGPYSEAKEQLAGVFIVDVDSPERAEEIAARIPEAQFFAVELRPIAVLD